MKNYDAIVIGAGVIGCASAYNLARAGYSVLIIERGEPACGASGGNLGQISLSDRTEPWHMKLAKSTIDCFKNDLSKDYDIELQISGGTVVLADEAQMAAAYEAVEDLAKHGIAAKVYLKEEIHTIEPNLNTEDLLGILHCPSEGKFNPFQVTLALLDRAQQFGAEIVNHTNVTGFTMEGDKITAVQTDKGEYTAKWIVNCTGPRAGFVSELAGVTLDALRWHKGTAFVTQPVEPMINGHLSGGGFLMKGHTGVMPQRRIAFCTLQSAHGSILIGQATEECESDDKEMNPPAMTLMARRFLSMFPCMEDLQVVRAWAAVTTYTKDGMPIFGFSKKCSNMLHAAGFKGAFTTCYGVGELVKEALEGRIDPDYAACDPDRVVTY